MTDGQREGGGGGPSKITLLSPAAHILLPPQLGSRHLCTGESNFFFFFLPPAGLSESQTGFAAL